jgi:hypothetical protein
VSLKVRLKVRQKVRNLLINVIGSREDLLGSGPPGRGSSRRLELRPEFCLELRLELRPEFRLELRRIRSPWRPWWRSGGLRCRSSRFQARAARRRDTPPFCAKPFTPETLIVAVSALAACA